MPPDRPTNGNPTDDSDDADFKEAADDASPDMADLAAAASAPAGPVAAATLSPGSPLADASVIAPPPLASRGRILRNFAGVAGIGILTRLVSISSDVYIRRTLGPVVIGMIDWNGAALAYASIFANPGLQTVARREAAQNPSRSMEIFVRTSLLQSGPQVVVIAACIGVAISGYRSGVAGQLLILQAIAALCGAVQLRWAFEAADRYIVVNLLVLGMLCGTIAATLLFVHGPQQAVWLGVIQVGGATALAVAMTVLAARQHILPMASFGRAAHAGIAGLGRAYRNALPLTLATLSETLYMSGATFVLGLTHGDRDVGLYTTSLGLVMLGLVPATTLNTVYFASHARAALADDHALTARVSFDFSQAVFFVTVPIGLFGWSFGRHVITLLYGSNYVAMGPYFEWLSLYVVLAGINIGLSSPLMPWGRNRAYLRIIGLGAVVNVMSNVLLIPKWGIAGAVATMLISELSLVLTSTWVRRDIFPISVIRIAMPLLPMVVVAATARVLSLRSPGLWILYLLVTGVTFAAIFLAFNINAAKGYWSAKRSRRTALK